MPCAVHHQAQRDRHRDHLQDQRLLADVAVVDDDEPEHQRADAPRTEPSDEQAFAPRDLGAYQRRRHRDQPNGQHGDHREDDDAPVRVAPPDDHGVPAEHREHQQFEQLSGGLGHVHVRRASDPTRGARERQPTGERRDEAAAVEVLADLEARERDGHRGQLRPRVAHPAAATRVGDQQAAEQPMTNPTTTESYSVRNRK